jgi:hypothetical protein
VKRESRIAEKIVAGYSYALDDFILEVEGWQPFNIDVIKELGRVNFKFIDDEGNEHDGGRFSVSSYSQEPRHLTYQQEQEMKRKKMAPVTTIRGKIPADSHAWAYLPLTKMLEHKFGYKARQVAG